ncbi:MAG: hypothetical protein ACRDOK_18370 [Streptosporangiaceae bacterium]
MPAFGGFGGLYRQCLELGDEFVQSAGVVDPGPVALFLLGGPAAFAAASTAIAPAASQSAQ